MNRTGAASPDYMGSGGVPVVRNLPKFPNNTELVMEQEHAELLESLLPTLNKYKCLEFSVKKTRRSPWVRAFCDLYHPVGPWGRNKFNHGIDITSNRKYKFKSYQIPTIYRQLQKYTTEHSPASQKALKRALDEYFQREIWYKQFLVGCEQVAAVEVNKPAAERVAIPNENSRMMVTDLHAEEAAVPSEDDASGTNDNDEEEVVVVEKSSRASRKRKSDEDQQPVSLPRTRSQKQKATKDVVAAHTSDQEKEPDGDIDKVDEVTPADGAAQGITIHDGGFHLDKEEDQAASDKDSTVVVSPETNRKTSCANQESNVVVTTTKEMVAPATPASTQTAAEGRGGANVKKEDYEEDKNAQQERLELKRVKLVDLLSKRRSVKTESSAGDTISEKIQAQIDKIDEELLEMILR